MKIFGVVGISTSGKTTLMENLIRELVSRGYSVGTVKSIGCGRSCSTKPGKNHKGCSHAEHGFTIDTKGKNSFRHRDAGASMTATWAEDETAFIQPRKLSFDELMRNYDYDFLIVEGFKSSSYPKIVTGISESDVSKIVNEYAFAVSGKIADGMDEVCGIKTYRTHEDIVSLVDLAIERAAEEGKYENTKIELNNVDVDFDTVKLEIRNLLLKLGVENSDSVSIKIETD